MKKRYISGREGVSEGYAVVVCGGWVRGPRTFAVLPASGQWGWRHALLHGAQPCATHGKLKLQRKCEWHEPAYSLFIRQGRVRQHDQLGFAGVGACGSEVNVGGKITSEEGLGRAGAESGSHCGSSASGNLR